MEKKDFNVYAIIFSAATLFAFLFVGKPDQQKSNASKKEEKFELPQFIFDFSAKNSLQPARTDVYVFGQ